MNFSAKQIADVTLINITGRIDHKTVKDFETALMPFLEPPNTASHTTIVINFKALDFITSAGLRMLMIAAKTCRQQGREIAVANLQPIVAEIFSISRFDLVLKVFPSVGTALQQLSPAALADYKEP